MPITNQEILSLLDFDSLSEAVRDRYTPFSPFSITKETRKGVKGFRTTDMRSMRSVRVSTKREATRVAKIIEADFYDRGKDRAV